MNIQGIEVASDRQQCRTTYIRIADFTSLHLSFQIIRSHAPSHCSSVPSWQLDDPPDAMATPCIDLLQGRDGLCVLVRTRRIPTHLSRRGEGGAKSYDVHCDVHCMMSVIPHSSLPDHVYVVYSYDETGRGKNKPGCWVRGQVQSLHPLEGWIKVRVARAS